MKHLFLLVLTSALFISCQKNTPAPVVTQTVQDSFPASSFPHITLIKNATDTLWLHFHSDVGLSFVGNIPNNCNIALCGVKDTTILPPPAGSAANKSLYPLEYGSWVQDIDGRTFFYDRK